MSDPGGASATTSDKALGATTAGLHKQNPTGDLPDPTTLPSSEEADRVQQEINEETSPFKDRDWRIRFYSWAGIGLRLLLIFGTLFSVVQFLAAREEKRVERTLELVDSWEKPEYQEAQKALKERLDGLNSRFASLLGENPSPTELAVYSRRLGVAAMTKDGGTMPLSDFQDQFGRIVYFLNRLSFCVEENLCSRDVADAYFRDFTLSFWGYFSSYVQAQRKQGSPSYGKPIEEYVRSTEASAPRPAAPPATASDPAPAE